MRYIFFTILVGIVVFIGFLFISSQGKTSENNIPANNVTVEDGKQVITLMAKNGFAPRKSIAKADIPTVLRLDTNGTFDCSSVVRLPSLNITQNLPPSGVTDVNLGSQVAGVIYGTCGMGMYPFEIDFQ